LTVQADHARNGIMEPEANVADEAPLKPLFWVASAKDDLRRFPDDVRGVIGFALYQAQRGGKHIAAKALRGFGGAGVLEIAEDHESGTFRAVYAIKFPGVVYTLDAFQKKSKSGIKTPQRDVDRLEKRLKAAELQEVVVQTEKREQVMKTVPRTARVQKSGGNVFADLGLNKPRESLAKAQLADRICRVIAARKLTQKQAAEIMDLDQPKVSALMRGRLKGFSTERLFRCLNDLGQEIEIIIRPAPRVGRRGTVHVAAS
jgi:phage-related protein/predicted XRE-type DNA-binding protein